MGSIKKAQFIMQWKGAKLEKFEAHRKNWRQNLEGWSHYGQEKFDKN